MASVGRRSTGTKRSVTFDMTRSDILVLSLRTPASFSLSVASSWDFSFGNQSLIEDEKFLTFAIGISVRAISMLFLVSGTSSQCTVRRGCGGSCFLAEGMILGMLVPAWLWASSVTFLDICDASESVIEMVDGEEELSLIHI